MPSLCIHNVTGLKIRKNNVVGIKDGFDNAFYATSVIAEINGVEIFDITFFNKNTHEKIEPEITEE